MQKGKFGKTWLLAGVLCALPVTAVVTGCNGNNNGPTQPIPSLVGNYTGVYRVTAGPDNGETAQFGLSINANGNATGTVTDASGSTANLSGTVNLANGTFTVTGIFDATGTTGSATGTINTSTGIGSGTFQLTNGNSGTVTLQKR